MAIRDFPETITLWIKCYNDVIDFTGRLLSIFYPDLSTGRKLLCIRWMTIILYTVTISDRTNRKDLSLDSLTVKTKPAIVSEEDIVPKNIFVVTEFREIDILPQRNDLARSIYSKGMPFILLNDQFFYGDINHINPNDVESIVMLYGDEAITIAGTIGAGNGIIKITTSRKSSLLINYKIYN